MASSYSRLHGSCAGLQEARSAFLPCALLLLFALGRATDILTNYLVVGHEAQSRCPFGQGLVFNDLKPNRFSQSNGRPVSVLQNAQAFAVNNSCPYGIYKKVNFDSSFCPEHNDIIGTWDCGYTTQAISFPAGTLNSTVIKYLYGNGMLYDNLVTAQSFYLMDDSFNHLVAWSSSAARDADGSNWDVLAAVQTNWRHDQPVQMDTIKCSLDAQGAENTHRGMASIDSLRGWVAMFQGLMYSGTNTSAVDDVDDQLAMLLNTMVMISGENYYLLATPEPGENQSQGCVKAAAYIPLAMIGLVFFVSGLFLISMITFLLFYLRLRHERRKLKHSDVKELDTIPQDALQWAVLAAREHPTRVNQQEMGYWGAMQGHGRLPAESPSSNAPLIRGANGPAIVEAKELSKFKIGFAQTGQEGLRGRVEIFR